MKKILQDLSFGQLKTLAFKFGAKPFRAKQLAEGLARGKRISQINIDPSLRQALLAEYEDEPVRVEKTFRSADGTEKYLFRLADGNMVEGVFMRYKYGNTQCVSTQVGCRMGCKFCASTLGGLVRDLTSGEILSQVLIVNAMHASGGERGVTNIVLMGSGEPLDNFKEVSDFLKNVTAAEGINISARNISLSTCGIVPRIYELADLGIPVNLTISLHQTTDEGRRRTMPVANKYTIAEILKACEYYFDKTGRRYIFEYSLIDGENADEKHAEELINLLKGRPCHVNLIRLNEVKERALKAANDAQAYKFRAVLERGGVSATVRRSMGSDIGGACGQLRAGYLKTDTPT